MSQKYLGQTFDIHGGGIDLIFPHHENELAQSLCANSPEKFAQVWMHNGYLMVEGEKMSKSLGNFVTVNDLLKDYHGENIRLCMLNTHYRQPLNWTATGLAQAKDALDRWYGALQLVAEDCEENNALQEFQSALLDDLNTPLAISVIHTAANKLHKSPSISHKANLLYTAKLIGLLKVKPEDWFKWQPKNKSFGINEARINELINRRTKARLERDFAAADNIRSELAVKGIILEDGPNGTSWKRN